MNLAQKIIITLIICTISVACGHKKQTEAPEESIILNEETVSAFALKIENAVLNDNPVMLNQAFDEVAIRDSISSNSIVLSSLDTDFGKAFWRENFKIGNYCVTMVNQGGDFKFTRYYEKDGEHHIVFRTYCDYGLRIDDYVVHVADSVLKIKEGFIYNLSSTLTHQIEYDMLYRIMQRTDPEGITSHLTQAADLLDRDESKQAFRLLNEHRAMLKEYPYFWQLYIRALFETVPGKFIEGLEQLADEGFDERAILTHKLLYFANMGDVKATEEVITKLIDYTGDDPIYLLFYGRSNYMAGYYKDALTCYENAAQNLPLIWDIWYGLLECYAELNDKTKFDQTVALAESNFGMTQDEIKELIEKDFLPKMTR